MNLETHLLDLVVANGEETAVRQVYGSCSPSRVRRVSSKVGAAARADSDLVVMLSLEQKVALTKSVARLEDMIGGVGSPTAVQWLLPHLKEWESDTLDWVLRYTSSFSYFSKAKSADAHAGEKEALRRAKAESLEREERRQLEARERKAHLATERLEKAVVRGDNKAVAALLDRGADPNVRGTRGYLPIELARELGHLEIVKILVARTLSSA